MSLKTCPECGNSFSCTGDEDCWCEDYQLHRKEMIVIMKKYDDCLCPECLGKFGEPI